MFNGDQLPEWFKKADGYTAHAINWYNVPLETYMCCGHCKEIRKDIPRRWTFFNEELNEGFMLFICGDCDFNLRPNK